MEYNGSYQQWCQIKAFPLTTFRYIFKLLTCSKAIEITNDWMIFDSCIYIKCTIISRIITINRTGVFVYNVHILVRWFMRTTSLVNIHNKVILKRWQVLYTHPPPHTPPHTHTNTHKHTQTLRHKHSLSISLSLSLYIWQKCLPKQQHLTLLAYTTI